MSLAAKFQILAMLILSTIQQGQSLEHTFCVGTGYSNLSEKGYGPISMGATSLYIHPLSTIWGANIMNVTNITRSDRPTVRVHNVVENLPNGNKNPLRGWLYLEIEKPASQYFNALAVWATTYKRRTSGEFVYLPKNKCGLWSDLKNYVPCSAVAVDMPVTSNMFIYTDDGSRKERIFRLLWRLSSSNCNKPQGFYFVFAYNSMKWNNGGIGPFNIKEGLRDANGNPTELGPILINTEAITPKFYGSSAPIFDPSQLSCTSQNSELSQNLPTWAWNITKHPGAWGVALDMYYKWLDERWDYISGVEIPNNTYFGATCKPEANGLSLFGGRCLGDAMIDRRVYAADTKTPVCIQEVGAWDPNELAQLHTNGHFKIKLTNRTTDVETGCDPDCSTTQVPTKMEIINVASPHQPRSVSLQEILGASSNKYIAKAYDCADRDNDTNRDLFGLCTLTEAGQSVYGVRQWHGLAMLFCSVIIIPIQCFVARYMKGAIPVVPSTNEAHLPLRSWYIVHIILTIPLIFLFGSAMAAVRRQVLSLGHSKTHFGRAHSFLGYVFFVIFVIQILLGFLRPLNTRLREMAIFQHWLVGTILNYSGVFLCMLTYGIPSSPTSHISHLDQENFYKMYNHIVPMILLLWFVMEVLFHTSMTIYAVRFDRKHNIKRTHFPVLLPPNVNNRFLIFETDYRAKAASLKKSFAGYVMNSSVIYVACCITIYIGEDESKFGLGPMTCTHDENGRYISGFNETGSVELRQFYIDNHCEYFLHLT